MNDQQVPASKPLYLTSKQPQPPPPKSPAALRGAFSAFQPKPAPPTVSVSSASVGARVAAFVAGATAQQHTASASPERRNGPIDVSLSRGRQPQQNDSLNPNVVRSTTSTSLFDRPARPSLHQRSSSTLAARHASARSSSPRHSPATSPNQSSTFGGSLKKDGSYMSSADALLGATASMSANAGRDQLMDELAQPVKSRILNFEKLPILPKPVATPSSGLPRDATIDNFKVNVDSSHVELGERRPSSVIPVRQERKRTDYRALHAAPELARNSSEDSAVSIATTSVLPVNTSRGQTHFETLSTPLSPPAARPLLSRSPPHAKMRHQDDFNAAMTVNALADAMVASSLASSRAASPTRKPTPPAPRRRSRSVTALHEMKLATYPESPRKPKKPPRPMKQTLRKQPTSDGEEVELTKRGRRHWMRKHPNMHAEGTRKRWRDKVTERERKRFEGVFAANRGLLMGSDYIEPLPGMLYDNTASGNHVVNIVVRDIWERSRLPTEVLREVYDLVSPEEEPALNREQFVVGMWLIDQRLKGRKLPVKVSASVWSSVRHSQGIKIRNQPS